MVVILTLQEPQKRALAEAIESSSSEEKLYLEKE
jgi:hypothetical protein